MSIIFPRTYCYSTGYGSGYAYNNCNSAWYRFGRWILTGVLILVGIIIVALVLCCAARRKRKRQLAYSTQPPAAYAPNNNTGYNAQQGYGGEYNQQQYAPPSGAPPMQHRGELEGSGGYYGQQTGVAQPDNVYQPRK